MLHLAPGSLHSQTQTRHPKSVTADDSENSYQESNSGGSDSRASELLESEDDLLGIDEQHLAKIFTNEV
jgi:hypothetical protein